MTEPIVWTPGPDRAADTRTSEFMRLHGISAYDHLYARSVADPDWFWDAVVDFLGIPFATPYEKVSNLDHGPEWATWFEGGELNLSTACVDRWATDAPTATAVVAEREDGSSGSLTFAELADQVGRVAGGLRELGVTPGDAVAVFLPMSAEAVISLLAVSRIGAVFIPIFSGYAAEAVAARLQDPKPRVLVCADGFTRRGRPVAMKEIADTAIHLAGDDVSNMVVVDYSGRADTPRTDGRDVAWESLLDSDPVDPVAVGSEHPVLIAYTSGTTGRPKGAVHVHGGFTVKIAQEGAFQTDIRPGDRLMWATDMGWIMGPWMVVAGLANGAGIVTYDGAPDHPGFDRIWEIVAKHRLTHLGLSPTLVRALQPHGADQAHRHDLSSLRAFGSTGEPWNPDPWWWLFGEVGNRQIPIVNLSGGTEIGACILSVNLLQGIKPTALGGPSLGMAADVFDAEGNPVRGRVGELVIRAPWPGMTRGFWREPDRYLATYWDRFPGVWVHGDWASIDEDGFWYLHGRSDDTLNIAGKRVGPAEIESAVVSMEEIVMAAAVGIPDPVKGESVAIFAVPAPGVDPDEELAAAVAESVTRVLGKAFRPSAVRLVADLPRTRSAKIMRRVVRSLALGQEAGDLSSLENPESLDGIRPL
jgi:acetyl-CoA synthetase